MMLFEMFRADTEIIKVAIVDRDGEAVDLTAATAIFVIRSPTAPFAALVTKTVGSGIVISGSSLLVTLAPADTDELSGLHLVEAEVTDYIGNVSTVLRGEMYVKGDIIQ